MNGPLDMAEAKDLNEINQILKTSSYLHNNILNGKLDPAVAECDAENTTSSISASPEVSFLSAS